MVPLLEKQNALTKFVSCRENKGRSSGPAIVSLPARKQTRWFSFKLQKSSRSKSYPIKTNTTILQTDCFGFLETPGDLVCFRFPVEKLSDEVNFRWFKTSAHKIKKQLSWLKRWKRFPQHKLRYAFVTTAKNMHTHAALGSRWTHETSF